MIDAYSSPLVYKKLGNTSLRKLYDSVINVHLCILYERIVRLIAQRILSLCITRCIVTGCGSI